MNIKTIFYYLLLIGVTYSCNSTEAPNNPIEKATEPHSEVVDSFSLFQEEFSAIDFSDGLINFHHWDWSTLSDSTYHGTLMSKTIIKSSVDTSFKVFGDDEYYAIGHISELNAYIIRSRTSEADYMQEMFLFIFDDKNTCTDWKKIASFYGAEGFINKSASWLSRDDKGYTLTMRNYNWSVSMPSGEEKKAEEIRKYVFEGGQFEAKDTHFITASEKKQYPFIGE